MDLSVPSEKTRESLRVRCLVLEFYRQRSPTAVFYAAIASALMSLIGLLGGIWAEKFDHLATVTNFVITPLAFLSGTFYSVQQLPDFAFWVTQYNPFFYMIDGFRYALTGHAEGSLIVGAGLLTGLTLILAIVTHVVLTRGYRLKS